MLNINLLGGCDLLQDETAPVEVKSRKALALLIWLAMHPGKALGRDAATGLLWGGRSQQQANASLSQAIYTLKKILGADENPVVLADANSIRLTKATTTVDALMFSQMVEKGTLDGLSVASKLYNGDFLEGFSAPTQEFDDWMQIERSRLHAEAIDALTALVVLRTRVGDTQAAMETARQLLVLDQYSEPACRTLMHGHAERGQISLASGLYDTLQRRLSDDLGMSPSAETEHLWEEIQRGDVDIRSENPLGFEGDGSLPISAYPRWARKGPIAFMASIVVIVLATVLVVAFDRNRKPSSFSPPSITVHPFTNLSRDPAQDYIASGVTDDLTTGLAKLSGIILISRESDTGSEQHQTARYHLEGGTRHDGNRLRVNARLVETSSGKILWTESFDGSATDIMRLQDRVVTDALAALAIRLTNEEVGRLSSGSPGSVAAYDNYLLGLAAYYRRTPNDNANAAISFQKALAEDADYSVARIAMAKVYFRAAFGRQSYADALGVHWTEAFSQARRMLDDKSSPPTAEAHVMLSWLALRRRHYSVAVAEAERALSLQPGSAEAMEALAEALIYSGEAERGAKHARNALIRNPSLPARPFYLLGLAEFGQNNVDAAITNLEKALEYAPEATSDILGLLAAAHGVAGSKDTAQAYFDDFSASVEGRPRRAWTTGAQTFVNPRVHTWHRPDLMESVYAFSYSAPAVIDRLVKGFQSAGVLEARGGLFTTTETNRLSAIDARDILFGARVEGTALPLAGKEWAQTRTKNGFLEGANIPTLQVNHAEGVGSSSIENDQLCDRWETAIGDFINCASVYRISNPEARRYWGNYFLATEIGAFPFSVTVRER